MENFKRTHKEREQYNEVTVLITLLQLLTNFLINILTLSPCPPWSQNYAEANFRWHIIPSLSNSVLISKDKGFLKQYTHNSFFTSKRK